MSRQVGALGERHVGDLQPLGLALGGLCHCWSPPVLALPG